MKAVHIGFPKTATTFLQTRVFPRLRGLSYVGPRDAAEVFVQLKNFDDTIIDIPLLRARLTAAWRGRDKVLYSDETLTGLHHNVAFVNRSVIARRLREVGFDGVIITIRNQYDAIESTYKQYVMSGGALPLDDYVAFQPGAQKLLHPSYFDYYPTYRLYSELFGAERVLVLQYESLADPAFGRALSDFLQVESCSFDSGETVNRSLSNRKTRLLRVTNHVTCHSFRPTHLFSRRISSALCHRLLAAAPDIGAGPPLLSTPTRLALREYYEHGNRNLERTAAIRLSAAYP